MRPVRFACAVASVLAFSVLPSLAQDKTPPNPFSPVSDALQALAHNPDGWTRNMDGSYRQAASSVLCPISFQRFHLDDVFGPSKDNPNIVGLCRYTDGNGRVGSIRIRKYVEGWGSDMSIAENDKRLMSDDPPPMLMRASVDRKTAASRLTVTIARNGYLIDCSVAQIEHSIPRGDFPLYCTTIP
ncbi:MAG TPA: hypothetical protein VG867_04160 [Rhizomicrobium sp.]|nr:hypothetical protein [Rhizomicrobium sp.]